VGADRADVIEALSVRPVLREDAAAIVVFLDLPDGMHPCAFQAEL